MTKGCENSEACPALKCATAYTLVELVLVLVIAGFLLSIVIPRFMQRSVDAKIAKTKANLEKLRTAFALYEANTGSHVPLSGEADALLNSTPPYLDEIPADGFEGGNDFYYSDGWMFPCHGPPYGGWCYADGYDYLYPNLPEFDPDYGNQEYSAY